MKKIILLFVLTICTSISTYATGLHFRLKSCERYGSEVLFTFVVENSYSSDRYIQLDKKWCIVLDAEGNKYPISDFTYGALCEGRSQNKDEFVFGLPENMYAPKGKNEMYSHNTITVPSGVNLLIRITAYDIPSTLKTVDCIQIRGLVDTEPNDYSMTDGVCINWYQANITDIK